MRLRFFISFFVFVVTLTIVSILLDRYLGGHFEQLRALASESKLSTVTFRANVENHLQFTAKSTGSNSRSPAHETNKTSIEMDVVNYIVPVAHQQAAEPGQEQSRMREKAGKEQSNNISITVAQGVAEPGKEQNPLERLLPLHSPASLMNISLEYSGWTRVYDPTSVYTAAELRSMKGGKAPPHCEIPDRLSDGRTRSNLKCCLGGLSTGGSTVWKADDGRCEAKDGVDYMWRWRSPTTRQHARSLAEVLLSSKKIPRDFYRVAFAGDSVTHQIYDGAVCDLAKRGYRRPTEAHSDKAKPDELSDQPNTDWLTQVTKEENTFDLQVENDKEPHANMTVQLSMYRMYAPNPQTIMKICKGSDIMVANWGLHFNDMAYFDERFPNVSEALAKCVHETNTIVIWRESSAQHFPMPGGNYQGSPWERVPQEFVTKNFPWLNRETFDYACDTDDGRIREGYYQPHMPQTCFNTQDESRNVTFCMPIASHDISTELAWRDRNIARMLQQQDVCISPTHPSLMAFKVRRTHNSPGKRCLHWIPYFVITAPLFFLHPGGTKALGECTHFCSTPLVWQPVWEGMAEAIEKAVL
jgi:hypothetical protein